LKQQFDVTRIRQQFSQLPIRSNCKDIDHQSGAIEILLIDDQYLLLDRLRRLAL
jgi:hypothetical protein